MEIPAGFDQRSSRLQHGHRAVQLLTGALAEVGNGKSTQRIPESIAQLQRQLDQFHSTQPRRAKLADLWQNLGRHSVSLIRHFI